MKRRIKKILSLIVACSIVTALFSFSAFASSSSVLGTYNGYAYSGFISISSNTGHVSLEYEVSAPLEVEISVYWTDDGVHHYYTNNSNRRTGTSVDVYWPWQSGQRALNATGSFNINGNTVARRTVSV